MVALPKHEWQHQRDEQLRNHRVKRWTEGRHPEGSAGSNRGAKGGNSSAGSNRGATGRNSSAGPNRSATGRNSSAGPNRGAKGRNSSAGPNRGATGRTPTPAPFPTASPVVPIPILPSVSDLDAGIIMWNAETGELLAHLDTFRDINDISLSADGEWLAVIDSRNTIRVWDTKALADGKTSPEFSKEERGVQSVAFSPDGTQLVAAVGDNIKLWEVPGGELKISLQGHTSEVNYVVFSAVGGLLATAGFDGTVRIWEPNLVAHNRSFVVTNTKSSAWGSTPMEAGWQALMQMISKIKALCACGTCPNLKVVRKWKGSP